MPKIYVEKAFNLIANPGEAAKRFEPGPHEVDAETANHWYVQQHLAAGGAAGARKAREEADAAKAKADAATAEYERLNDIATKAEHNAGVKPAKAKAPKADEPAEVQDPANTAEDVAEVEPTVEPEPAAEDVPEPVDPAAAKKAKAAAAARAKRAAKKA